ECAKLCDTILRRVSCNYCRIDRSDRDTCDPVRQVTVFRYGFVNTGLIRAKCSAALKNQRDLLVVPGFRPAGGRFPVHEPPPALAPRRRPSRLASKFPN